MSLRISLLVGALLVAIQAVVLWGLGQPPIAASGHVLLWVGEPLSPGNSQHLGDWYTLSHIAHGIIFYWLAGKLFPQLSVGMRLLLALGVEVGWEMLENTPLVIEHYRQQALAQGYFGDSITNSLADTLAMVVGFIAARRLPVWASVVVLLLLEAAALFAIRDGLTLNIIGFFYQFEFIQNWQSS
jgi:hypothetical protein